MLHDSNVYILTTKIVVTIDCFYKYFSLFDPNDTYICCTTATIKD